MADEPLASAQGIVAVDLGKTSCRAEARRNGVVTSLAEGAGSPGLADADGVRSAAHAVIQAINDLDAPDLLRGASIGIGAAGAVSNPEGAAALGRTLALSYECRVAVTSDVLTAHIGAFDGDHGTVLIAGTGAVAYGLTQTGELSRADGWGPLLGDDGGGQWIGRRGLALALAGSDGRGEYTSLTDAAKDIAPLEKLSAWISESGAAARQLAGFAPTVLAHAESGDPVAAGIVTRAVDLLAVTARSATRCHVLTPDSIDSDSKSEIRPVTVVGGLVRNPYFLRLLLAGLASSGLTPAPARGSPLDGAALLTSRTDLPHEGYVHRESFD